MPIKTDLLCGYPSSGNGKELEETFCTNGAYWAFEEIKWDTTVYSLFNEIATVLKCVEESSLNLYGLMW